MHCPRCGSKLKKNDAEQMYICESCGYRVPMGEEYDLDWEYSDSERHD